MGYGQRCSFEHICICESPTGVACGQLGGPRIQRRDLDWKYKFGSYLHIGGVQ